MRLLRIDLGGVSKAIKLFISFDAFFVLLEVNWCLEGSPLMLRTSPCSGHQWVPSSKASPESRPRRGREVLYSCPEPYIFHTVLSSNKTRYCIKGLSVYPPVTLCLTEFLL